MPSRVPSRSLRAIRLQAHVAARTAVRSARGSVAQQAQCVWRSARREAASAAIQQGLAGFYRWLDARPFPAIVAYATHRLHIVALVGALGVLMLDNDPLVQLKVGNYTNVTSALVACIVLLGQVAHRRETHQLHENHAREMAALHDKVDRIATQVAPRPSRKPASKPASKANDQQTR